MNICDRIGDHSDIYGGLLGVATVRNKVLTRILWTTLGINKKPHKSGQ